MSSNKNGNDLTAAKRAAVTQKKSSASRFIALVGIVALLGVGGWFLLGGKGAPGVELAAAAPTEPAASGEVKLKAADFADGEARFYSHKTTDGLEIRYFVVRSADGVIRAAFDACDACWRSGKGYRQESDEMVCNNCDMRFPTDKVNEVKGGCNPAPLERTIKGDEVVIRLTDIEAGRNYFDLPGRKGR